MRINRNPNFSAVRWLTPASSGTNILTAIKSFGIGGGVKPFFRATTEFSSGQRAEEIVSRLLPVLQVLADPSRLRILLMLQEREQCVCHLTEAVGLSQGTVSHHMAALKRVGLVVDRRDPKDGRWVYYSLASSAMEAGRWIADLLDASTADQTPADCTGR